MGFFWKRNYLAQNTLTIWVLSDAYIEVIGATLTNGSHTSEKVAFVGYSISDSTILYIPESYNAITISGKGNLTGDILISSKGYKRGHLHGFIGSESLNYVNGKIHKSNSNFPEVISKTSNDIDSDTKHGFTLDAGIENANILIDSSTVSNSFLKEVLLISSEAPIFLNQLQLSGHLIIESTKFIKIAKDAHIEDIIVKAPYIEIESGFSGSLQCIASDSITIHKNCMLTYPSIVAIVDSKNDDKLNKVTIQNNAQINGLIFCNTYNKENSFITFADEVIVNGQVYTTGLINSEINLNGCAILGNPIAITTSGFHDNYLLNTKVTYISDHNFAYILPGINDKQIRTILKWVY